LRENTCKLPPLRLTLDSRLYAMLHPGTEHLPTNAG
jgi:hypothetical protein